MAALHQGYPHHGLSDIGILEAGLSADQIIQKYYPQLTKQDIEACLHYAATLIRDTEYTPFPVAT